MVGNPEEAPPRVRGRGGISGRGGGGAPRQEAGPGGGPYRTPPGGSSPSGAPQKARGARSPPHLSKAHTQDVTEVSICLKHIHKHKMLQKLAYV